MPVIELGRRPELVRVMIQPGDPFFTEIKLADEGDTYEVAPEMVFAVPAPAVEIRWIAELASSTVARFDVEAADVDAVIAASKTRQVSIEYNGVTWYAGHFEIPGSQ